MVSRISIYINEKNPKKAMKSKGYIIIKNHELDRRAEVFGESDTLEGAQFIADTGFLEDEKDYNDCEELEGIGIGFSYLVFDKCSRLAYEKRRIEIN